MFQFDGAWWFPDGETHLPDWMQRVNHRVAGRLTYQYTKYEAALRACLCRRVAVDVGAHVGLWSYWMARDFAVVEAFEPVAVHRTCWERNIVGVPAFARLYPYALGASVGVVALEMPDMTCSGRTVVVSKGDVNVEQWPLDCFAFPNVDLLKIDCDGYEAFVIEGACETIQRCRPAIVVEQKTGCGQRYGRGEREAVDLLEAMGAQYQWNVGGDYLMTFPEAG